MKRLQANSNKLPQRIAYEILNGICYAYIVISDPEGRGIKSHLLVRRSHVAFSFSDSASRKQRRIKYLNKCNRFVKFRLFNWRPV